MKLEFEGKFNLTALYQLLYLLSNTVTDMHTDMIMCLVNAILEGFTAV